MDASTDLETLEATLLARVEAAANDAALEALRVEALGKQGSVSALMKNLGAMSPDERKAFGPKLNGLKDKLTEAIVTKKASFAEAALEAQLKAEAVDVTLPPVRPRVGAIHPVSQVMEELARIFGEMGFSVEEGPDIETDFNNFTALNFPPKHPARETHDTFFMNATDEKGQRKVLRTHTSPVQIRYMQSHEPPIRIVCPGRVYRVDHDATHSPMFHQIEGLWIDEGVSLADLKGTLTQFCRAFFERDDIGLRFRPSYFPFVEPGVEIDMEWERKDGEVKYLEVGGAGVVHPDVLRNGRIDPERYSGFAFGMGLDRLAMLKYGVNDLRLFFENDLKFLRQFR